MAPKKRQPRGSLKSYISDAGAKRLARAAGVARLTPGAVKNIRHLVGYHLGQVVNKSAIHAEHARRVTVQESDLKAAVHSMGERLYGSVDKIKRCAKFKLGLPPAGCVFLSRAAFRSVSSYQRDDKMRFSPKFLALAQYFVEHTSIRVIAAAYDIARVSGKGTLDTKHFAVAFRNSCKAGHGRSHGYAKGELKKRKVAKKTSEKKASVAKAITKKASKEAKKISKEASKKAKEIKKKASKKAKVVKAKAVKAGKPAAVATKKAKAVRKKADKKAKEVKAKATKKAKEVKAKATKKAKAVKAGKAAASKPRQKKTKKASK